jgi:hypothetical protein
MDYSFIEVGTSDFDTLTQASGNDVTGIAIEPLAIYLDRLPSPPKVRKLCMAVSPDNLSGTAKMYWLPEAAIAEHKLPAWLRGCNSLNHPHPQHTALNILPLVQVSQVPVLPIGHVWTMNMIGKVGRLKLDTEGCDADILLHLHAHLESLNLPWPDQITFEANSLTNRARVTEVIRLYQAKGYGCCDNGNDVTMLRR